MKSSYVITDNSVEKIWVACDLDSLGICRKDKEFHEIATIILNHREASELVELIQEEFLDGEDNG